MKHRLLIATSLLAVSTLASADAGNYTYPQAEALPQDDTSNFQRDPTLLTGYDLNLSADRFAKAWLSKTNERERIKANMYLLGVVDASEGTAWCKGRPFCQIRYMSFSILVLRTYRNSKARNALQKSSLTE